MSVDMISDFLTIIRNALKVSKRTVRSQYSGMRFEIARILKEEGFIKDFEKVVEGNKSYISVTLKYVDGEAAIHEITRISKPGRRRYESLKNLKPVIGGLGISILSTSGGVITDKQAREKNMGGEVICQVW